MVKFNKHHVTDGKVKARVLYSLDNRTDGRKCVTIYARDYTRELYEVLPVNYKNETDIQTDYFDQGRAVLFEDHPLYAAARDRAEAIAISRNSSPNPSGNIGQPDKPVVTPTKPDRHLNAPGAPKPRAGS